MRKWILYVCLAVSVVANGIFAWWLTDGAALRDDLVQGQRQSETVANVMAGLVKRAYQGVSSDSLVTAIRAVAPNELVKVNKGNVECGGAVFKYVNGRLESVE